MAEQDKVSVQIESTFNDKGIKDAKKGITEVSDSTKKLDASNTSMADNFVSKWASIAAGVWAGVKALQGAWEFAKSSVNAYIENARAVNTLSASLKAVGITSREAMSEAKRFASEMQNLTGIADESFLNAQRLLANYKVVGTQAQDAIRSAYALSVGAGQSFETALMQIARAAAGSTTALSRYGITISDSTPKAEQFNAILGEINNKFGAAAQAQMGDMGTKVAALAESWGDLKEQLGKYLIPALDLVIAKAQKAIDVLNNIFSKEQSVDQIAYANNLKRIVELQKELAKVENIKNSPAYRYNPKFYEDEQKRLENELKILQDAQTAIEERNYKKLQEAKIEDEILKKQEEKVNLTRTETLAEQDKLNTLKEQRDIMNRMGLSDSDSLSWDNASTDTSMQSPLSTILGGESALAAAESALEQVELEKERLEELYNLRKAYVEQEITDNELKNEAIANLEKQYDQQSLSNTKKQTQAQQQLYSTMWTSLTSLATSKNRAVAAIGKTASIAQATMSMFTGAAKALELPYPANLAAAATVLAQGAALVSQIQSVEFAKGGLVKAVTGGVNAVIGEGGSDEAVLPLDNERAMRRIGGAIAEQSDAIGGANITININASGGLQPFLDEITEAIQNSVPEALRMANATTKAGKTQEGLTL